MSALSIWREGSPACKKKKGGIRPLVVGEFLRAVISKVTAHHAAGAAAALQPLQIGVSGGGPLVQAAVLTARCWAEDIEGDEILLKLDLNNAHGSAERAGIL